MSELTYRDVVRLLELIDISDSVALELTMGDLRLSVEREGGRSTQARPGIGAKPVSVSAVARETGPAAPVARSDAASEHPDAIPVSAPMGGMFYAAPAPGQPPFVTEGQEVKEGDQVGIVEVMKLFTAVTAPCDGKVVAIAVANQDTVAKDDILMLIVARP